MEDLCTLDMNRYRQLCDEPTNPYDSIHFEEVQELYETIQKLFEKVQNLDE